MRWIFFLLLLANAAFFGYMQFSGGGGGESLHGHEPLNADKVHLLGMAPPALAKPKPAEPQVCLEWGTFAGAEIARAKLALETLQLGDKVSLHDLGERTSYWVVIPPLKSKQEAEAKIAEVKGLDIEDVALVPDSDKLRNAVSLGVFSTEEAANKFLASIREKGVRTAKLESRKKAANQANFTVRDASETVSAQLVKIKQDFPASELKAIACDAVANPQPEEKK